MPTCRLPARNLTVAYADRGAGPPLVLLHAFPLSSEMWRPQLDALSDAARVIAPDLPGFGASAPLPGMTIEDVADVVAESLAALGVSEPVVLGGLSMGGYAAFAFARRHPDRLRGLILADTKPEPDDDTAKANRDKLLAGLEGGTLTAAGVVEQMLPKLLGDRTRADRPDIVAEVRRIGSAQSAGGVVAAVRALRDRPDSVPGLGNIRVPTLILVGEQDAVTPPAGAQATAARIAGSRLVVIPGAGHLSNLEEAEAFNAAVQEFLAGM